MATELSPEERALLADGVGQWLANGWMTDGILGAMGYDGTDELLTSVRYLSASLRSDGELSDSEWVQALALTEIFYVSAVFAGGPNWGTRTGHRDAETIAQLRVIQKKLGQLLTPPYQHSWLREPSGRAE